MSEVMTIFLIAPNVSEQMGGEAMKALQIFQELKKVHPNTIQITHERNEREIAENLKLADVLFVRDDITSVLLWKSVVFNSFVDVWFSRKAVSLVESYVKEHGLNPKRVIVHHTEPNSPVSYRTILKKFKNVVGPINGNIYYPKPFRRHESLRVKLRRILHFPLQWLNSWFFPWALRTDTLLIAGGERTAASMRAAGAQPKQMVECLDCGIRETILQFPRTQHRGENLRFVFFGRLVFHKGVFLIIESLVKTKHKIVLDVVGRGPELERCQTLVRSLNLEDRVNFLGWYPTHGELLASLHQYRGLVFPSLEDANGIAVQEAMALGLPAICLDWGGPQLLVEHGKTGYLVKPGSQEEITQKIAEHLDELAINDRLAEQMSLASRQKAEQWRWANIIQDWVTCYDQLAAEDLETVSSSQPVVQPSLPLIPN